MIELPDWAVPNGASPSLLDFGGFLRPGLGGEVQRIDRLGNRFRVGVSFPPSAYKDRGRVLVSRLIRAKTEGLRIEYPLLGFKPGAVGSPVVDGAGQAGRTLAVRGLTPRYVVREGQPLSIERADGRHYLHFSDAEVIADATGDATLSISPMLRYEFDDGAAVHLARPMIEGFIDGEEIGWQMSLAHHVAIECTIEEAA